MVSIFNGRAIQPYLCRHFSVVEVYIWVANLRYTLYHNSYVVKFLLLVSKLCDEGEAATQII